MSIESSNSEQDWVIPEISLMTSECLNSPFINLMKKASWHKDTNESIGPNKLDSSLNALWLAQISFRLLFSQVKYNLILEHPLKFVWKVYLLRWIVV